MFAEKENDKTNHERLTLPCLVTKKQYDPLTRQPSGFVTKSYAPI